VEAKEAPEVIIELETIGDGVRMTEASLRLIIQGLNDAGVKYLVVGGLAVIAHGYVRNTQDLDLLVQLTAENLSAAIPVLERLGYRPKVPVTLTEFVDPRNRERWQLEKQMVVLGLRSDAHRETDVDIFVEDPLGFEPAFKRVHYQTIEGVGGETGSPSGPSLSVPFCSYEDLVTLKKIAGRPRDLDDLRRLRISRGDAPERMDGDGNE
jgi:predicted nucleotidyltransferase